MRPPAAQCIGLAAYEFTLAADGQTLVGRDTRNDIPMSMSLSADGKCFVGHWTGGDADDVGTLWNFAQWQVGSIG